MESSICTAGTSSSISLDRLGATSRHDGLLGTVAAAIKNQTAALVASLLFSPGAVHSQWCPLEVVMKWNFSFCTKCGENKTALKFWLSWQHYRNMLKLNPKASERGNGTVALYVPSRVWILTAVLKHGRYWWRFARRAAVQRTKSCGQKYPLRF